MTKSISIHAPTRGATDFGLYTFASITYFNPRSHERSDNIHLYLPCLLQLFQSTLPREERLSLLRSLHTQYIFQSTLPREERRCNLTLWLRTGPISIHAPTRGATQHAMNVGFDLEDFNPRSHERSDSQKPVRLSLNY